MKYRTIWYIALLAHSCLPQVTWLTEKKLASYMVPVELQELLDDHSEELTALVKKVHKTRYQKHGVWQFDWLPGYYVKYNIARVINREVVARCIEEHDLDLLHIPPKQLYHIKGRPTKLSNKNYVVVIKELTHHPTDEPMGLEQVQQFIRLIETSGHCSTFSHNYVRLEDGRISFIDTDGTFNVENPLRGIIWLLDEDLTTYYTQEAAAAILDKIAYHYVRQSPADKDRYKKQLDTFLPLQKPYIENLLRKRIHHHSKKDKR